VVVSSVTVTDDAIAPEDASPVQAVIFGMAGQSYALPIEAVKEIQQVVGYMPVPGSGAALLGVVDLRGEVVPLVDLRKLVGLPDAPLRLDSPLIFAFVGGRLVALLVDDVEDVATFDSASLQPPSTLYPLSDRLHGIVHMDHGLIFVLDPERLVPDETVAPAEVFVASDAS